MDPITIMAGASAAFSALKKGMEMGKDLHQMSGQLSQWAGAMSDLTHAEKKAKNPPWWKALSGSVEQEAIQAFSSATKAREMREELRSHISFAYGPSAWEELVRTEAKIRKKKQAHEYRQEAIKETIITWIASIVTGVVGISGLAYLAILLKGYT